ncbi:hypothetical protein RN616_11310 [Morganella morganii]|uniref:hypothetical protein n=1 Tax=Morganella morganii TaxID=582 RepID=UPI0028D8ED09|nr:hypothetical protein [Morganella morganii]WNP29124.1 hypothetical protein RN616_11310 [Morganella morganii]
MNNAIAIKFDYSDNRKDPEEILNILTGYVKFYKSIGLISLASINEKDNAQFDLIGLKTGSAIAIIRCVKEKFNNLIISSASKLVDDLYESDEISTRDQIEDIANNLSETIENNDANKMRLEPIIDIEQLGILLSDFSILNSKLKYDESAYIGSGAVNDNDFCDYKKINTSFTFIGTVNDVLSNKIKHHKRKSKFYVNVSVNKGDTVWKLEETETKNIFQAKIASEDWLEKYQSGFIDPIGPKDLMEAIIEYDEINTTTNNKNKKSKFKNVRIIEVIDVIRTKGNQGDLFQKRE